MRNKSFQKLRIWAEAHSLALEVYKETRRFPGRERFALVDQMRRAAVSVPTNIAEGAGRGTVRDFINFLYIARGSAQEVAYQCILAHDLGFLPLDIADSLENRYNGLSAGIYRCIQGLKKQD